MIKRLILAAVMVVSLAVSAMAQDMVKFNGVNLTGDTLYLPSSGSFAVGVGTDLLTVNDFVTVRGEYVDPLKDGELHKAGIGVGINVADLVNKIGGTWLIKDINASIGAMGLTNLDGDVHLEPAIYLSVVTIIR